MSYVSIQVLESIESFTVRKQESPSIGMRKGMLQVIEPDISVQSYVNFRSHSFVQTMMDRLISEKIR